ncbi:MAG: Fic family protein, partial [Clostridia bacterium]|nr:Fic family protein [Clostridia bacterium]
IIEGGKINGVSADDIQKINNLKHAWQFVLDDGVVTLKSDYSILCLINKLIEEGFYYNAGKLRSVPVAIGGTKWKPELPIESVIVEQLTEILKEADVYERAINALLFITKKQLFIDGNKRTSVIFANHILISNGAGLIVIPEDSVPKYKKLLIDYYETDQTKAIKQFLFDKCLAKI